VARPRISAAARARFDRLPDVDLSGARIDLPAPRYAWATATKREYAAFCGSEAAKAVREAEAHLLMRYFDLVDREAKLWAEFERTSAAKTLALVHQCHRMMLSLGRELGIGGLSRRNLGVPAVAKPGSRLDAFRAEVE
jgi:hypothetical protein